MKSYLVALVGLVVFLSGCSGGLEQEPTDLAAQRLESCSFQGAVTAPQGYTLTDISARCYVVKDAYPNATARVELQRRNPNTGVWQVYAYSNPVLKKETIQANEYYVWNHMKANYYCRYPNDGGTFRGKITVTAMDYFNNPGNQTYYYTPTKTRSC